MPATNIHWLHIETSDKPQFRNLSSLVLQYCQFSWELQVRNGRSCTSTDCWRRRFCGRFSHLCPQNTFLQSAHPTFNPSEWKISLDCRDQLFLNGRISSRWLIIIIIIIIMPIIIIPIINNVIMMIVIIITRRMRRNSCFFEMGRYRCSLHHVSNFSAGKSPRTHPVSFGTL